MNLLHCLKSFITAVDCGSFSAAARRLYISPSKISKQITWLEGNLKVKLFIRSTTKLTLTEQGQDLYPKTIRLFDGLEEVKSISDPNVSDLKGTINIYLTVTPAIPYLTTLVLSFIKKYPLVNIDLAVGAEAIELYKYPFDLALSFDSIKHPKLVSKKFFCISRHIFAAPAYLQQYGTPQTIEDLANHNCLVNTLYGLQNKWILNKKIIHVFGNFKSNNAGVLKQVALAGEGLIWAPLFSVKEELAQGKLLQVLPEEISPNIQIYAIYPKYLKETQKINLLMDFLFQQAAQDGISEDE